MESGHKERLVKQPSVGKPNWIEPNHSARGKPSDGPKAVGLAHDIGETASLEPREDLDFDVGQRSQVELNLNVTVVTDP